MTAEPQREKTVIWQDTKPALAKLPALAGIDYLRAMMAGELPGPPIASLMQMELTEVEEGSATFVCTPDESHFNPIGTVHGGYACTVLDSALGCAVQTTLPAGTGYTSIEIKINYLRPIMPSSAPLRAIGTVTKPGNRVAFADGVLIDAAGKTVATATGSLLVFPIGAQA
ncbi:MAG: PaaI family thioesterase [Actinobacteria bacterium]|nr:PaaI family thioesterase [Actinomycetota bacterium]